MKNYSPAWFIDLGLSLCASFTLATIVPWGLVMAHTVLTGGDNPAHSVLVQAIGESFFSHLSLIHYCYKFWGGFELFQFYFVLPYWVAAVLAKVVYPAVAFKLVTLAGILCLPFCFYWMSFFIGLSRPVRFLASVLSIGFLFTESHTMWGGNIYSALAGEIGHAWGFCFFVLAFGKLVQSHDERRFSKLALVFSILGTMCHFYAFVMLLVFFSASAVFDFGQWAGYRKTPGGSLYATAILLILIMSWWLLPLVYYSPWCSDMGDDWRINLLSTYTRPEIVAFSIAIAVGLIILHRTRFRHPEYGIAFLFLIGYLLLFYINPILNRRIGVHAFIDCRLWSGVFFGLYLLVVLALEVLYQSVPPAWFFVCMTGLAFLIPSQNNFVKAKGWMRWNYRGIEANPGWPELQAILDKLKAVPPSRISYELSVKRMAQAFGTERGLELLPYFTHHEILVGAMTHSATFANIGYMLQCLMSDECAGWPTGSLMPEKDIPRGIAMMKALGVQYHIAVNKENREILNSMKDIEKVYEGRTLALYRLKSPVRMVEAFSEPLPYFISKGFRSILVNLPRWDLMRNTGLIFLSGKGGRGSGLGPEVKATRFINFLIAQWMSRNRVFDRGFSKRQDRIDSHLNACLVYFNRKFDSNRWDSDPEFMIADHYFDPDYYLSRPRNRYSEVALPLVRSQVGQSTVSVGGKGYQVMTNLESGPLGRPLEVAFTSTQFGEDEGAFTWIVLKPHGEPQYAEASSTDPEIQSGFPGPRTIQWPARITDACDPWLEKSFGTLTLHTKCPGKPHLIKYAFYPKWKTDVPIYVGTNGFMALTPLKETTVLHHRQGFIDTFSQIVSLLTCLGVCWWGFTHRRKKSDKRINWTYSFSPLRRI